MRRIAFIFALAASAAFAAGVSSARFGDIGLYDNVVTNVNLSGLIEEETDPNVPSWAKSPTPPATGLTTNEVLAITAPATNALVDRLTTEEPGKRLTVAWSLYSGYANNAASADMADSSVGLTGLNEGRTGQAIFNQIDASTSSNTTHSAQIAQVSQTVSAWETYWDGDEVRVTVTNYDSAVQLPSLYIEQKIEDTEDYRVVWDERTRWDSNDVQMAEIRSAIDEKADRAWGFYDSHTGEYAPDGYTWLSSPKIAIAGGLAYQRTLTTDGAIWVLTSNGMVAQTGGDTENGFFRIKDDEGNTTFEIVRGNKRMVGATASGIKVTRSGGVNTVTIPYNVVSENAPTLYGTTDLSSGEWTQLSPTWSGQSGAWTGVVTSASSTYFVKGEYETGGETYIRNAAPISVDGGLYATNTASGGFVKIRPKYNGSTITWEVVQ